MDDSLCVRRRQRVRKLATQVQRLRQVEWPAASIEPRPQRLAAEEFHHDVRRLVGQLPQIRNLHKPRMRNPIHRPRFVEEAGLDENSAISFPWWVVSDRERREKTAERA